jgi:hypothetical protein
MKLNVTALSLAAGLIWGGAILLVGIINLIWSGYGKAFLDLAASIYPGFHPGSGLGSVILGTLYGLLDGAIGGALIGWFYNLFTKNRTAGSN